MAIETAPENARMAGRMQGPPGPCPFCLDKTPKRRVKRGFAVAPEAIVKDGFMARRDSKREKSGSWAKP